MKITKYVHSCLLVETADRVAVFDPGSMSEDAFDFNALSRLDDIFITHMHPDHMSPTFIKKLIDLFPAVRITTTDEAAKILNTEAIKATTALPAGVTTFEAHHESMFPVAPAQSPQNMGIHFLNTLSHPGDCHSFSESKAVLALPVTAPWGRSNRAAELALELKPAHILPIHDWHWRDEARNLMYDRFEKLFSSHGITFHKLETGQPIEIEI